VAARADYARMARFIGAYLDVLQLPVSSILDAGAGTGHFRSALRRRFPAADYLGLDISGYACARYGWTQASIANFAEGRFDLVICHDVLQYLGRRDAEQALANLGRCCDGALYFMALTREDWRENCDQSRTDGAVHLRSADWYRRRLAPCFRNLGGGLFLARRTNAVSFALHASR
jgi:SAM-dependent methyltransferase